MVAVSRILPWTAMVSVAPAAGVTNELDLFSFRVDPGAATLDAYASVVDNRA